MSALHRRSHHLVLYCMILLLLIVVLVEQYYGRLPPSPEQDMPKVEFVLPQNTSDVEKALILAKTRKDNVRWTEDLCNSQNYTAFVYTTDVDPEPGLLLPKAKKGRETAAYLSYILDYYDALPQYSIFLHSSEDQWHNDLFGASNRNFLPPLRLAAVDAQGYVNLRCSLNPGCPTAVHPWDPTEEDIKNNDIRVVFADVYMDILGVGPEDVPKHIGNVCCAQFAVSRDRIRQRPRRDYERMLAWADQTTQADNFGVGWVFEKLWHIIFGMDAIYCPDFDQCRCDVYGWCGPFSSGETLQAVM